MPDQANVLTDSDLPMHDDAATEHTSPDEASEASHQRSVQEQVARKIAEQRRQEMGGSSPVDDDHGLSHESEPDEPEPDKGEGEAEAEDEGPDTVQVKVYGKTYEVPKGDVDAAGGVAAYQKQAAAAEKLRRANEVWKDVKEAQRRWQEQTTPKSQAGPEEDPAKRISELTRKLSDAQLEENYDEMGASLKEIVSSLVQPKGVDPIELEGYMERRDREKDRISGTRWFDEHHPDLAGDRILRNLVSQRVQELENQYPNVPPSELIAHAASEMDAWYRSKVPPAQKDDTRMATKRAMNTPGPASQRRQSPPEKRPETISDYVARVRKERGLE